MLHKGRYGRDGKRMEERRLGYALLSRCRGELMGLAMLWVMQFHSFAWRPKWQWLYYVKGLGFCGVDIFLFLSGMGLALSLCRKKQSYGGYLKRRLVRVLPTYWLVVGIYGVALRLAGRTTLKTVAWTISTLFYWFGKPHYFNWYVPALLGFYLLTPLTVALLRRVKYPQIVTALTWAACFAVHQLMSAPALGEIKGGFVMRLPVFVLGCVIGIWLAEERQLTRRGAALWCAVAALGLAMALTPQLYYVPTGFWFSLICAPLCLAVAWLLERLPKGGLRRGLREIGGASLEIYLVNVIFVLERGALEKIIPPAPDYLAFYAVTVPLNLLLGIALHYALSKPLSWLRSKVVSGSEG